MTTLFPAEEGQPPFYVEHDGKYGAWDNVNQCILVEYSKEQMIHALLSIPADRGTLTPAGMLSYLKGRGCRIGGVTLGERGLVWYDETGAEGVLPALDVPAEKVVDTNGAGDIFHGAYVYSAMARPDLPWREHFLFARGASSHAIQHLGNEASLPSLADIAQVQAQFPEKASSRAPLDAPDVAGQSKLTA